MISTMNLPCILNLRCLLLLTVYTSPYQVTADLIVSLVPHDLVAEYGKSTDLTCNYTGEDFASVKVHLTLTKGDNYIVKYDVDKGQESDPVISHEYSHRVSFVKPGTLHFHKVLAMDNGEYECEVWLAPRYEIRNKTAGSITVIGNVTLDDSITLIKPMKPETRGNMTCIGRMATKPPKAGLIKWDVGLGDAVITKKSEISTEFNRKTELYETKQVAYVISGAQESLISCTGVVCDMSKLQKMACIRDDQILLKVKEKKIVCSQLKHLPFGQVKCNRNYTSGSNCSFHCQPCYKLKGESSIECQIDAQWSSEFPTCTVLPKPWYYLILIILGSLTGFAAIYDIGCLIYLFKPKTFTCFQRFFGPRKSVDKATFFVIFMVGRVIFNIGFGVALIVTPVDKCKECCGRDIPNWALSLVIFAVIFGIIQILLIVPLHKHLIKTAHKEEDKRRNDEGTPMNTFNN